MFDHIHIGCLTAATVLAVALTGCTGTTDRSIAPVSSDSETTSTSSSPPSGGPSATASGTQITLEVDGQAIGGRLNDSPTARSLVAQLPLTLTFGDHGGQEKYAELPQALDLAGAPPRSDAQPLTIGYYVPDQRLILYYAYVGTFSGIVPIGSYDNAAAVEGESGRFTVTIRETG